MSLTGLKIDPRFENLKEESRNRIIAITSSCLRIHQRVIQLEGGAPDGLQEFHAYMILSHKDFRIETDNYQHSTAAFVEGAIGVYKWSVETFGAAIIGALAAV